jgi:hypothetical protein
MDLRRAVALFGAMEASMARTIEFMQIFIPKIARRFRMITPVSLSWSRGMRCFPVSS